MLCDATLTSNPLLPTVPLAHNLRITCATLHQPFEHAPVAARHHTAARTPQMSCARHNDTPPPPDRVTRQRRRRRRFCPGTPNCISSRRGTSWERKKSARCCTSWSRPTTSSCCYSSRRRAAAAASALGGSLHSQLITTSTAVYRRGRRSNVLVSSVVHSSVNQVCKLKCGTVCDGGYQSGSLRVRLLTTNSFAAPQLRYRTYLGRITETGRGQSALPGHYKVLLTAEKRPLKRSTET